MSDRSSHRFMAKVRAPAFVAMDADTAEIEATAGYAYVAAGTAALPSFTFHQDTDTGFYRSAADTLGVSVAGALDFSFSAGSFNVLASSHLDLADSSQVRFGDADDIAITWNGTLLAVTQATANSAIDLGVSGAGIDLNMFGDTVGRNCTWDQSADSMVFGDSAKVVLGTGSDDTIQHDGTNSSWVHITGDLTFDNQLVTGSTIMLLGTDTTATDFQVQNNSAVAILTVLPESASGGTTVAMGLRTVPVTAAAIAAARTLTAADSGGCFSVAKTGAYTVTLPAPLQGLRFKFMVLDTGANVVTFASSGANVYGMLNINNVLTQVNAVTNVLSASAGSIGDWLEFVGIDSTHYLVVGACKDAADFSTS